MIFMQHKPIKPQRERKHNGDTIRHQINIKTIILSLIPHKTGGQIKTPTVTFLSLSFSPLKILHLLLQRKLQKSQNSTMESQTSSSKNTHTTKSDHTSNPKTEKDETQTPSSSKIEIPKSTKKESKKRKRDEDDDIITPSDLELGEVIADDDEETKALEKASIRYVSTLVVNIVWCEEVKYKEFLEILHFQKWTDLFGNHAVEYFYPHAMDEFCENFDFEQGTVTSEVNKVKISFDANFIADLFGVPNRGYDKFFKGKYNLRINGVGKDEILMNLNGEKGINNIDHNTLSPLNKLLFNVVRRSVLPRTQKRSEANLLDCAVIYCLANYIPVNFPSLMISHLDHSVPSGNKVGYVTLMTRIFKHFKVPLEGYKRLGLKKEQYVQGSTLHGLNLGVMDGKTMLYSEILKLKEAQKEKEEEEEKRKVRKSSRVASKTKPLEAIPTVNLDEEEQAAEPPMEKSSEDLLLLVLKELKAVKEKQADIEGQVFMLRQTVSNLANTTEARFDEVIKCLLELLEAPGTPTDAKKATSADPTIPPS